MNPLPYIETCERAAAEGDKRFLKETLPTIKQLTARLDNEAVELLVLRDRLLKVLEKIQDTE